MATNDEIRIACELFHKSRPQKSFEKIDRSEMGIFATLKFLLDAENEVNSKDISSSLGISSARMAVLLKKLESKNLIVKTTSKSDARAVAVSLSDKGRAIAEKNHAQMLSSIGKIVDEFGLEELQILFKKLEKIKEIMLESVTNQVEEAND